jgi:hypothetical protein
LFSAFDRVERALLPAAFDLGLVLDPVPLLIFVFSLWAAQQLNVAIFVV